MFRLLSDLRWYLGMDRIGGNVPLQQSQHVEQVHHETHDPQPTTTPTTEETEHSKLLKDVAMVRNIGALSQDDRTFIVDLVTRSKDHDFMLSEDDVNRMKGLLATVNEHLQGTDPERREVKAGPPLHDVIKDKFGDVEQSLRSTFFKSSKTVNNLLDGARNDARQQVLDAPNKDELLQKLKTTPKAQLKDEIARSIGGLRSEKYGDESTYSQLSANKKALVDAIYQGMMSTTVSPSGNLDLTGVDKGPVRELGTTGTLKQDVTIDGINFQKGDRCVVIRKDDETYLQQLALKEGGSPENELDYELKPELHKLTDLNVVKFEPEKFNPVPHDQPLFPGPISVSDIKQGAIGDCFLIAGLYSMVQRNPETIHNLIKDNGDGTVTVKMFDKNEHGEFTPKHLTFDKSTLARDAHAQDTLWVQMLEKAYALNKGSYEGITHGGHSNDVFEAFLGTPSTMIPIREKASLHPLVVLELIPKNQITEKALETAKTKEPSLTDEQLEQLRKATPGELQDLEQVIKNVWKWPQFGPDVEDVGAKTFSFGAAVRREMNTKPKVDSIQKLLLESEVYQSLAQKEPFLRKDFEVVLEDLRNRAKTNPTVTTAGKTFQTDELIKELTTLSQQGKDLFETLKIALDNGEHVALGSKKDIGRSQGQGHSGGESIVDGMAGQHAYAVLDVVEMNGQYCARIANPWGNEFSRDYDVVDGNLVAKQFDKRDYSYLPDSETKAGAGIGINESWMPLQDLDKVFDQIYVTK